MDAPSGITRSAIVGDTLRFFFDSSSDTGIAAAVLVVDTATVIAPNAPPRNFVGPIRATKAVNGKVMHTRKIRRPTKTQAMKMPRLCTRSQPSLAVTGAARPKTPTGAVYRIHMTSLISASPTSSAISTSRSRRSGASVPAAAATSAVKTIRGSIAPLLAAANGLDGTRLMMKSIKVGSSGTLAASAAGMSMSLANCRPNLVTAMPMAMAGISDSQ